VRVWDHYYSMVFGPGLGPEGEEGRFYGIVVGVVEEWKRKGRRWS